MRNWEDYQGYAKRGPRWIKLHASLLNDPAWITLPVVSRAVLPALWLAASQQSVSGELPNDPALLAVLCHASETEIREALPHLERARFIVSDDYVAGSATKPSPQTEKRQRESIQTTERVSAQYSGDDANGAPSPSTDEKALNGARRVLYVQQVWDDFCERSGKPQTHQMSQAEYGLACSWYDKGIRLSAVLQAMSDCQGIASARSLRYLEGAVEEEWVRVQRAAVL